MNEQKSSAETILIQKVQVLVVLTCFAWFFVISYNTGLHIVGTAKFLPGIHKICIYHML